MVSESIGMYRLKPIFELNNEITMPENMYKMKNLHIQDSLKNIQDRENSELGIIKKRQDILLQKLADIKTILAALKDELAAGPKIDAVNKSNKMCVKPNFTQFGITHDVVLNISITKQFPPYSLLVLNKVWPNIFLKYSCHLHSSASSLPIDFKQFQDQLESKIREGEPDLNVRILWKASDTDCEFVISPFKSIPLIGEVSFLRFLSTSFTSSCDVVNQTLIDEKLDACYCLAHYQTQGDVKQYLQILSNGLEKYQWLCGDFISIVDIAAWSVFKKIKKQNLGMPKLSNWYKNCCKEFEVQ